MVNDGWYWPITSYNGGRLIVVDSCVDGIVMVYLVLTSWTMMINWWWLVMVKNGEWPDDVSWWLISLRMVDCCEYKIVQVKSSAGLPAASTNLGFDLAHVQGKSCWISCLHSLQCGYPGCYWWKHKRMNLPTAPADDFAETLSWDDPPPSWPLTGPVVLSWPRLGILGHPPLVTSVSASGSWESSYQ